MWVASKSSDRSIDHAHGIAREPQRKKDAGMKPASRGSNIRADMTTEYSVIRVSAVSADR